jgi:hypothetical protein
VSYGNVYLDVHVPTAATASLITISSKDFAFLSAVSAANPSVGAQTLPTLTLANGTVLGATWFNGVLTSSNGVASKVGNLAAPTSITFPATTVTWTNTQAYNIQVYINNAGVTGTLIKKNGTTISTSVTGNITIGLQPGEYFSETYTVGTPVGTWSPF